MSLNPRNFGVASLQCAPESVLNSSDYNAMTLRLIQPFVHRTHSFIFQVNKNFLSITSSVALFHRCLCKCTPAVFLPDPEIQIQSMSL